MSKARVVLPPKMQKLFTEHASRGDLRYRGAYGGRGSGKSASFALMSAIYGYVEPLRILCTRDLQNSIKDSMLAEIKAAVHRADEKTGQALYPWLIDHYDIGENYIKGANGTDFIMKGLRNNIGAIKSTADIGLCIVEEAEDVREDSWIDLEPTIRAPRSEIWVVWNPKKRGSPVDQRFRQHPPKRSQIISMNWRDNPWFCSTPLDEDRQHQKEIFSPGKYEHIWEGGYLEHDESKVFRNWQIKDFVAPADAFFRMGADWGFSKDPSVLLRCFIQGRDLFIDYEAYQHHTEIMDLPELFARVPQSERWPIVADSARPEVISHMRGHGYSKMMPTVKGAGSLDDGISWLQSYNIIVHPRCENLIQELEDYSYKVDPITKKVTSVLEDKDNHCIDALRYACESARRAEKQQEREAKKQQRRIRVPKVKKWK